MLASRGRRRVIARVVPGARPRRSARRGRRGRAGAARRARPAPERDALRRRRVGAAPLGRAAAQRSGAGGGLAHHQRRRAVLPGDEGDPQRPAGRRASTLDRRRQGALPGDVARERRRLRQQQLRLHLRPRSPARGAAGVHRQGRRALDLAVAHRYRERERRHLELPPPVPGGVRRVGLHDGRVRPHRSADAVAEIIPPAIDPRNPKNLGLPEETARQVLEWIGMRTDRRW